MLVPAGGGCLSIRGRGSPSGGGGLMETPPPMWTNAFETITFPLRLVERLEKSGECFNDKTYNKKQAATALFKMTFVSNTCVLVFQDEDQPNIKKMWSATDEDEGGVDISTLEENGFMALDECGEDDEDSKVGEGREDSKVGEDREEDSKVGEGGKTHEDSKVGEGGEDSKVSEGEGRRG